MGISKFGGRRGVSTIVWIIPVNLIRDNASICVGPANIIEFAI